MSWSQTPAAPVFAGRGDPIEQHTDALTIGDGTNNFTGITSFEYHVKLGPFVFTSMELSWTGKGSASGPIYIGNLIHPLYSATTNLGGGIDRALGVSFSGGTLAFHIDESNLYRFNMVVLKSNGNTADILTDTAFGTSGTIHVAAAYITSD